MLNLIASVVMTLVSLAINTVMYIRTPLIVGAVVLAIIMSFPATSYAAVIQCNIGDCSILTSHWYDLILERKAAVILLLVGGGITIYLLATEKGESV